jgi:hypothetical protein
MKKHLPDPISKAAMDVVEKEKESEEKRKKEMLDSFQLGTIIGEALAHAGYRILSTLSEWKRISEIRDDKKYLKIPGISSFEGFLDWMGCPKTSAWRNMKIARYFDPQDVPKLERLKPSQRDLLAWSGIPKEQLNKILYGDGNETEDDLREALGQTVLDNKKLKDERAAEKKTSERLLQAKQALIDRQSRDLLDLEGEAKDLRDKVNGRLPKVDWTDEEKEYNQVLSACQMQFMEILATIRNKIPLDKAPSLIITQLFFLYIDMAISAQEERFKLKLYDDGSEPAIMDMEEEEIPSPEMMIANTPLTAPMAEAFNRWRERRLVAAQSRKGAKEREN